MTRIAEIQSLKAKGTTCAACNGAGQIHEKVKRLYDMWSSEWSECFECKGWGFHGTTIQMQITGLCRAGEKNVRDLNAYRTFLADEQIDTERKAREWADARVGLSMAERAALDAPARDMVEASQ